MPVTEVDLEDAIFSSWADSHKFAQQSFSDKNIPVGKPDLPTSPHLPHLIVAVVFNVGQPCRVWTSTRCIARTGRFLAQCFMRSHQVVLFTPFVKRQLAGLQ